MISKSRDARLKIIPSSFDFLPKMNPRSLSQIAKLTGVSLSSGDGSVMIDKISTDSRKLKLGELFVALRGENFDGHNFVESAANAGAAGAIVESNWKGEA